MTPLYALHKNAEGEILDATATTYSFEMEKWLRALDPRPGDSIEFGEKAERKEPVERPEPLAIVPDKKTA